MKKQVWFEFHFGNLNGLNFDYLAVPMHLNDLRMAGIAFRSVTLCSSALARLYEAIDCFTLCAGKAGVTSPGIMPWTMLALHKHAYSNPSL